MVTKKRYRDPDLARHGTVDEITGWRELSPSDPASDDSASSEAQAVLAFSIDGVLVPVDQQPNASRPAS